MDEKASKSKGISIEFFFLYSTFFLFLRVSELLDYSAEEMTGMSMYALCHGEDVHKLKSTHEDCK